MSIASEITRINNNIANAYTQVNSKGGTLPATQNSNNLASAISSIPQSGGGVENPALVLWDWEGTKLAEYSANDVQSMTALPAPNTLHSYITVDHEFLTFQEWNWSLVNIKTWIQNHEGKTLEHLGWKVQQRRFICKNVRRWVLGVMHFRTAVLLLRLIFRMV